MYLLTAEMGRMSQMSLKKGDKRFLSLAGVDFTTNGRPMFTTNGRPVFTTDGRPVFTTLWENLFQKKKWERTKRHGADTHEFVQRNHLPAASWRKRTEYSQRPWSLAADRA
jgi:hypothetical protein